MKDRMCECGHLLSHHDTKTPNRDLTTCSDCYGEKLCLVNDCRYPATT